MFRKMIMVFAVSLLVFGVSKVSRAMNCGSGHGNRMQIAQSDMGGMEMNAEITTGETVQKAEEAGPPVGEAGNQICPVSGEKIDEKTRAAYEYQGKVYNFCCPMCIDEFKKDPEKYIKKVEEEMQAKSQVEKKKEPSTQEGMEGMPGGHHHP